MVKNYFKIAFRGFYRNRVYTLINVAGLAFGFAVVMLISLWVWDEWNFNKSAANHTRVGRVLSHTLQNGALATSPNMPFPLAAELREKYAADFEHVAVSWDTEEYSLSTGKDKFRKKGRFIEPDGAKILSLQMLQGDNAALHNPSHLLISESAAHSMFGNSDAIGQVLKIDHELEGMVAGIYKDFPANSDFHNLSFVAPWKLFASAKRRQWVNELRDTWTVNTFEILVQTRKDHSFEKAAGKIKSIVQNHLKADPTHAQDRISLAIHPMEKWHLYSDWENGVNTGGQIGYIQLFVAIAAFILLLACINFINLTTARSEQRAREVGVRKAIGSMRAQLVFQFICESLIVVTVSFLFALLLVQLSLPYFNAIADKQIQILATDFATFTAVGLVFCLIVSLIAGGYPALYLSSFKPVNILKSGTGIVGRSSAMPRKVLVVLQLPFLFA